MHRLQKHGKKGRVRAIKLTSQTPASVNDYFQPERISGSNGKITPILWPDQGRISELSRESSAHY